jgi:hypothetical protein
LHKSSIGQPDIDPPGSVSRAIREKKLGLDPGSSVGAADFILEQIDKQYNQNVAEIEKAMTNDTLKVSSDYLNGLTDGDGSYFVTIQPRPSKNNPSVGHFQWTPGYSLTMEKTAELTLRIFCYALNVTPFIYKLKSKPTYRTLLIRSQSEMAKLLKFNEANPMIGEHKLKEFQLVQEFVAMRESNLLRKKVWAKNMLKKIYAVKAYSDKGGPRRSIDELLSFIDLWFEN